MQPENLGNKPLRWSPGCAPRETPSPRRSWSDWESSSPGILAWQAHQTHWAARTRFSRSPARLESCKYSSPLGQRGEGSRCPGGCWTGDWWWGPCKAHRAAGRRIGHCPAPLSYVAFHYRQVWEMRQGGLLFGIVASPWTAWRGQLYPRGYRWRRRVRPRGVISWAMARFSEQTATYHIE